MKDKQLVFNLVIVGMTLGTAWAIRGQFGHEQGAAWAGAIGAIVILLLAKRDDWYQKFFKAALTAAIGWGAGGMMSYGIVVGYGRGIEFLNVYYGLAMLFVIGGLYGFIGGGLFGLVLQESEKQRIKWASLIAEMIAGALIFYWFIVAQLEWFMTPPRSEAWGLCFGAALALTWHMIRHKHKSALRVAVFAGLGGGFGFAFGNFLQLLGSVSGISFNFWNVMEYSLGFFGGLGMAYGVFTSDWPVAGKVTGKWENLVPALVVALLIPFIVWYQSFSAEKLIETFSGIYQGDVALMATLAHSFAIFLILFFTGYVYYGYFMTIKGIEVSYSYAQVRIFFIGYFGLYIIYTFLITGAFISFYRIEQYLYIVNFVIILGVLPVLKPIFHSRETDAKKWLQNFVIILFFIGILAFIAIHTHGPLSGAHNRF